MQEHQLGQTLIVKPEVSFSTIDNALKKAGWKPAAANMESAHCIENEPETMTWEWAGGKPFICYTFNPIAKLRVLDVATLPPQKRGEIAHLLPLLTDQDLQEKFSAENPKEKLLALWTSHETQRLDCVKQVASLHHDQDEVVVAESLRITEELKQLSESRTQVLATLRVIASAAEKIIRDIHHHPDLLQVLMPSEADCRQLFDEHLAVPMHQGIKKNYQTLGNIEVGEDYYHLEVISSHAGLLRWPNELSERFPRAYRDVAAWLKPDKIWLSWAWVAPLASEEQKERMQKGSFSQSVRRISFDGLAWLDDHWVWLPKMYRVLAPAIQSYTEQAIGTKKSSVPLH